MSTEINQVLQSEYLEGKGLQEPTGLLSKLLDQQQEAPKESVAIKALRDIANSKSTEFRTQKLEIEFLRDLAATALRELSK